MSVSFSHNPTDRVLRSSMVLPEAAIGRKVRYMLILKRLTIWLIETMSIVFLLGLGWLLFVGYDKTRGVGRDLSFSVIWIGIFSFTTGYLFTTSVTRAMWRDLRLWSYPVVASVLSLIHAQICFVYFGTLNESERLSFQIPGAVTVFACTMAGSFILRRWVSGRSSSI